ncbi:hypothetical protein SD074_06050 [Prolixibacter sp. SD074]|nr:hypothetical protein SD074_06050 [Prolixibacter sp. SD074]
MSRNRTNGKFRNRSGEILFIDARNMGHLINRRTKVLSEEDIQKIAETYHESGLKSLVTPKSPKGDFFKLLIFGNSPLGLGVKMVTISSSKAF